MTYRNPTMHRPSGKIVAKRRLKVKRSRRKMRQNFRLLKRMVSGMVRSGRLPCDFQLEDLPQLKPYQYSVHALRRWSSNESLVLQPYRGQTTFLIGCGRFRQQTNCGGYFHASHQEATKYHREHDHRDCYTADATLGKCPDYLGGVENLQLPQVPDESLDRIVFEGVRATISTPFYREVHRVMKEGAVCSSCDGTILFEKKDDLICFPNGKLLHTLCGFPDIFEFVADGVYPCDECCALCDTYMPCDADMMCSDE